MTHPDDADLTAVIHADLERRLDEAFAELAREQVAGPCNFTGLLGGGMLGPMRTLAEARNQFAYHPATEDTAPRHAAVRDAYRAFLDQLWEVVPDGPEKTLALRALQESQMYSNLAIALTAPADEGETRGTARTLPEARKEGPPWVRVTVDGHPYALDGGQWDVRTLREEFGVAPGRVLFHHRPAGRALVQAGDPPIELADGMRFTTGRPL